MSTKQASNPRRDVAIDGNKIREIRESQYLSQADFATKIGKSLRWVSDVERTGNKPVLRAVLGKVAAALGVTPDTLLSVGEFDQNVHPFSVQKLYPIPMFDLRLAASHWADVHDAPVVTNPRIIEQGLFRVRLQGNCMEPKYKDGEIVEFRLLRVDAESPIVGKDYYVQRSDGTATFKRLEKISDDELTMRALNGTKYPKAITVERELVVRMAVAVAKVEVVE